LPDVEEKVEVNFTDIDGHWGKDYIIPLAEKGIIKGKSETTFEPDSNITRAEFLTLALKVGGIDAVAGEAYADVAADAWFANTVATAKAKGLIDENMTLDGNFYPDNNITREEMTSVIVKLYESLKGAAKSGDVTKFSDNPFFSDWAISSIGKAVELGVVTGNPDGTFNATGNATRAEAAVIFSRLLKLL
jgi:bacillolysin